MDNLVIRAQPQAIVYVVCYRLPEQDEWEIVPVYYDELNEAQFQELEVKHGCLGVTPAETRIDARLPSP